ncbi:MAG: low molecular weight protein-tyrosine-phosphatase, partial [Bacteroidota bacterium]|nr:low molecular weight protein-tyrosine-phosphatase [Bacteroidota bacterium]
MKKRILFVCLGNICRSPSAEAVMQYLINKRGLSEEVECDSAGILSYHQGEKADCRMQVHALRRGYQLTSISRPVNPKKDFEGFDMIIGMDDQNIRDLQKLTRNEEDEKKIYRIIDFARNTNLNSVPDPYY